MNTPSHGINIDRKNIPASCQWNIQDIYPKQEDWEKACTGLKELITDLETCQGSLQKPAILLQVLQLRDRLSQEIDKIYAYARLQQDADNGDPNAQALSGKAEGILASFYNAVSFIDSEITSLPKEQVEQLKSNPLFADYDFYLKDLERMREHVLPGDQESILAQSQLATGTGAAAFRALVSADMEFPPIKDGNGNSAIVSEGCYMLNMSSDDRVLRKNSFTGLMNTYHHYRNTLAATLTGTCRSRFFYAKVRGYKDTLEASLAEDNIPVSLYDNLIQTIHANLKPLHDYIALKKETLGYDSFHPYDLYVPLSREGGNSFSVTFAEACKMVKQALQPLGKTYIDILQKAMNGGWIDIYENKGKRSGAYSWNVYGVHPYVLLNFQPRYNSISTLAHELGHSLHSYFSCQAQPYAKSEYSIFCAEVASTTNENLLLEYALANADKSQKIFLLSQFLEAVRTTVYRQVQFAEFEKFIHSKIAEGESLQAETLDQYWLESNQEYYGPALTVDKELSSEWSRIPHFHTPFYVYKYATGYSAATAFSEAILKDAEEKPASCPHFNIKTENSVSTRQTSSAVEKYLGFLHAGGSDYSLNILKEAGVDLNTPQPIQVTLDKFAEKLNELKDLL
ncbi:MAG: oligoendopeptidase F [Acidaminococcaceae bacterium]|nr:oligoendopeptidase F [Acidaminococcaceae bacterium]